MRDDSQDLLVDLRTPCAARVHDWYLGGENNYAIDREFGTLVFDLWPDVIGVTWQSRQFLGRVVRNALDAGVRQFLDFGSGMPTEGNVHEIVSAHLPDGEQASVVYVDHAPEAVAHSRALLDSQGATGWAGVARADMRDPDSVLRDETVQHLLDPTRPVCVLMVAVLHFVGGDDDVPSLLRQYSGWLAPRSWLAITHLASDEASLEDQRAVERFRKRYDQTENSVWVRDRTEMSGWFAGLDGWKLLEPELVHLPYWRPCAGDSLDEEQIRLGRLSWCGVLEKSGESW